MPASLSKYFCLRNKSNNMYLDTCGHLPSHSPGSTEVTLWNKRGAKEDPESQVWYWDAITSTLRNALSNLCLDINGENRAVINFLDLQKSTEYNENLKVRPTLQSSTSLIAKYSPKRRKSITPPDESVKLNFTQQWKFNKQKQTIENVVDNGKVLEVVVGTDGVEVIANHLSLKNCQLWAMEPTPLQYFNIFSQSNQGHVMDVLGGRVSSGGTVGLYVKKKKDNDHNSQLWFEDEIGNLRTKLNDKLVLSATVTSLKTEQAENTTQRWVICGNRIVSLTDHRYVLSVGRKRNSFSIDTNDTYYLCSSIYQGSNSQHWNFVPE